jgi:hypothetical protein
MRLQSRAEVDASDRKLPTMQARTSLASPYSRSIMPPVIVEFCATSRDMDRTSDLTEDLKLMFCERLDGRQR